jgi:amino acid adenylation domain-containing protein
MAGPPDDQPFVIDAIARWSITAPDRPAVKDLDRQLTYGSLWAEATAVAAGLAAHGVAPGDRVALQIPNSVDFVVAAVGCMAAGAAFVPLAVTDPAARLEGVLHDCQPAAVITPAGDGDPTLAVGGAFPVYAIDALRSGGGSADEGSAAGGSGGGGSAGEGSAAVRGLTADSPAYAIYTSGTTGTPKGVIIGQAAFAAAVRATVGALSLGPETRTLCVSPFHFDGSFATLFPTLYAGGSVVIRPRDALLYPRTFFNAVAKEAITYTGFSASYLQLLLSSPQVGKLADTTLDIIALGGEATPLADIRAFWAVAPQVQVFNRYGPTETTIAVTHIKVTPELTASGTVPIGQPHAGVTFHLIDEDGQPVDEAGRVGELYIGGNQLMQGYWRATELTAEVLRDDVLSGRTVYRTGDLVYRDEAGNYIYVDRADKVVKRSGVRISLIELGDVVRELSGVSAAACAAFDDGGQLGIAAFVVADPGIDTLALQRQARTRLPDTMLPNCYVVVDALPVTGSGKLDERSLLAGAGLTPAGAANAVRAEARDPDPAGQST